MSVSAIKNTNQDLLKRLSDRINERLRLAYEARRAYEGANWNEDNDGFTHVFWKQFIKQFWVDTEIGISKDRKHWAAMNDDEKDVLKKNLQGLTVFDTLQSEEGMPQIKKYITNKLQKAALGFMETMESIHAKSYSTIFQTLLEKFEIKELEIWANENKFLQFKVHAIDYYYQNAGNSKKDLYLAMVASVYLESFLFYSGFYYPLYLAGHGRMTATADMINLILRDESIHGVYVGLIARNLFQELTPEEQVEVNEEAIALLQLLIDNEVKYTHDVYGKIGLAHEVVEFVKYNANKALQNLGMDPVYEGVKINPIVEAGLDTETKTHDFFSVKGNGYIKANIEELQDEDFDWDDE
jgi:ribonucleoside-diphosphate reductase beta chain